MTDTALILPGQAALLVLLAITTADSVDETLSDDQRGEADFRRRLAESALFDSPADFDDDETSYFIAAVERAVRLCGQAGDDGDDAAGHYADRLARDLSSMPG